MSTIEAIDIWTNLPRDDLGNRKAKFVGDDAAPILGTTKPCLETVEWVERSEPGHVVATAWWASLRSTHPTNYNHGP
jgi:hypothetical protein